MWIKEKGASTGAMPSRETTFWRSKNELYKSKVSKKEHNTFFKVVKGN